MKPTILQSLNETQLSIVKALADEMNACTNGEFGYMEDVKLPEGITRKQFSGYISGLCQTNENLFEWRGDKENGGTQFALTEEVYTHFNQVDENNS